MNIIFDMDGVLFDSENLYLTCWKEVAAVNPIPEIEETVYQCIGVTNEITQEIFHKRYGNSFSYEKYRTKVSECFQKHVATYGMPIKPGVFELLDYLKKSNAKIGLASSTKKSRVEEQLTAAGLRSYFDVLVCGDMVKKSKPEPDIFLLCAQLLSVEPKDTYVIEDSYHGIQAASRAGMRPIMVPDLLPANEEMRNLSTVILSDLHAVKSYFEEL